MKKKDLPSRNQSRSSGAPRIATLLLAALLSCVTTVAFAYDFSAENGEGVTIYYNYINGNKEAEVTCSVIGNSGYSGDFTIPATVTVGETTLNVTSIGKDAFCYCLGLKSVSIPNSVTSIGEWAFGLCSSLTSVSIPDGVTSIGERAFDSCTGLISVSIPSSVTSIGSGAFSSCSSLASIDVENGNTYYQVDGNCLIEKASNTLIRGCSLTSVSIPDGVTNIGGNAFAACKSLTSVTIPNSVTSIGKEAFYGCTGLTEVTLQGKTLPTCGYSVFNNVTLSNATLYCKAALVETCQSTDPWDDFGTIKAKPFSITISDAGIATGCFDDDLDFSKVADVKAYIVSAFSPTEGQVLLTRATKIPAETGFIVKGSAGTYTIPAVATDYVYSNMLVGVLEATTVAKTDDTGTYTNYVLVNDATNGVGFYVANGDAVPANKAYLQIPTSAVTTDGTSDAKASLSLSFDDADDTTDITQTREQSDRASGKTVIYNLNGQRKQSLTKGLNIVNGKKIFVK